VQVLISIQSMILVDDPYFNEPGYESSRGSAHGKSANDAYNRQQQHNTLRYAILPALKHPDPCFVDVIKYAHLLLPCACMRQAHHSLAINKLKWNHCICDAQNKPVWIELTCVARA